jgi:hypothetical protein
MISFPLAHLIPPEPLPRNVAGFTAADVRRYGGRGVFLVGEIGDRLPVSTFVNSPKKDGPKCQTSPAYMPDRCRQFPVRVGGRVRASGAGGR